MHETLDSINTFLESLSIESYVVIVGMRLNACVCLYCLYCMCRWLCALGRSHYEVALAAFHGLRKM